MRYFIQPIKKTDPTDETGKKKLLELQVTIWPEPWGLEYTAPEKQIVKNFQGNDRGVQQAAEWIRAQFEEDPEKWSVIPNILDCEPDIPNPCEGTAE